MVRRCAKFSGGGGGGLLGGLGGAPVLGQGTTLRATFNDVKSVAITAGIGAGGAILTDIVFDQLQKNIDSLADLTGYKRALCEAAVGIGIGIFVGKFMKNPRLGAKLAAGPVVLAILRIAGEMLNSGPFAADKLAGLGMMAIDPLREQIPVGGAGAGTGDMGGMQIGPGAPQWMLNPEGQMADAGAMAGVLSAA